MCPGEKDLQLSVKVLVYDNDGRCLVLKRSSASKGNPGKWDLPGGKVNAGEEIEDAARREVLEETGFEIETGRVIGEAESESSTHRIAYLVIEGRVLSGELKLSDEHEDFKWVARGEMVNVNMVPQFKHLFQ